jgi:F420-non-reducing hydrogenase iron-sulfur subunit
MGIEPGRLHFSWISSAEAGKFVDTVREITDQVSKLGPAAKLIKGMPVLPEDGVSNQHLARSSER